MIERRLIDTNLIVRFLVRDNEKQAKVAAKLFEASDRGELQLVVLPEVLAECVFVLESFYKRTRAEIAGTLNVLISSPGVDIEDKPIHVDALARFGGSKLHFVDCTIAAYALMTKRSVATFDADFRKIRGITVNVD